MRELDRQLSLDREYSELEEKRKDLQRLLKQHKFICTDCRQKKSCFVADEFEAQIKHLTRQIEQLRRQFGRSMQ